MDEPMTIYELPYFESREHAERVLENVAADTRPLILPEFEDLEKVTMRLRELAEEGSLTVRDVLLAYQYLRESHSHTDIFCRWKVNPGGKRCGGKMHLEVDAAGAYYQCGVDSNHVTPK